MRQLPPGEVVFTLECEPEWASIEGNCSAIDDETDKEVEDWIRDQLSRGNEWAWCSVVVRARWNGFEGSDCLGRCSYVCEADFRAGGYFDDMKAAALAELNRHIQATAQRLEELEER